MSILINPQHMRLDIFKFTVNLKGCPGDGTDITVQFRDGKFDSAFYPFKGTYTREQWTVLGVIAGLIGILEGQLKGEIKYRR